MTTATEPTSNQPTPESRKEDKTIVTPYAFGVAGDLLGHPLASPWRRLNAQIIDVFVIAALSSLSAFVLAVCASITFYKAGKNLSEQSNKTWSSRLLRYLGAAGLFFVTYLGVEAYNSAIAQEAPDEQAATVEVDNLSKAISAAGLIALKTCDDYECLLEITEGFGEHLGSQDMDKDTLQEIYAGIITEKSITDAQKASLLAQFNRGLMGNGSDSPTSTHQEAQCECEAPKAFSARVADWFDKTWRDVSRGFGWAMLYYTALTAWFGGRTLGKKLLKIRVVRLDGETLSLWESFGRYGGYGAGLATGSLGFFQIFWDPNRQAIQDKIAETLVLHEKPSHSKA